MTGRAFSLLVSQQRSCVSSNLSFPALGMDPTLAARFARQKDAVATFKRDQRQLFSAPGKAGKG